MNILVNKFCNLLMRSGNKTIAYNLFSEGFFMFLQKNARALNISNPPITSVLLNKTNTTHHVNVKKSVWNSLGLDDDMHNHLKLPQVSTLVSPEALLNQLVENIRPLVEVRKVRVARATYQVPAQIPKAKGQTLALRWIIEFANKRKQKERIAFAYALAQELDSAFKKQGLARQRRTALHRLAESNRSHMRYRWW